MCTLRLVITLPLFLGCLLLTGCGEDINQQDVNQNSEALAGGGPTGAGIKIDASEYPAFGLAFCDLQPIFPEFSAMCGGTAVETCGDWVVAVTPDHCFEVCAWMTSLVFGEEREMIINWYLPNPDECSHGRCEEYERHSWAGDVLLADDLGLGADIALVFFPREGMEYTVAEMAAWEESDNAVWVADRSDPDGDWPADEELNAGRDKTLPVVTTNDSYDPGACGIQPEYNFRPMRFYLPEGARVVLGDSGGPIFVDDEAFMGYFVCSTTWTTEHGAVGFTEDIIDAVENAVEEFCDAHDDDDDDDDDD